MKPREKKRKAAKTTRTQALAGAARFRAATGHGFLRLTCLADISHIPSATQIDGRLSFT